MHCKIIGKTAYAHALQNERNESNYWGAREGESRHILRLDEVEHVDEAVRAQVKVLADELGDGLVRDLARPKCVDAERDGLGHPDRVRNLLGIVLYGCKLQSGKENARLMYCYAKRPDPRVAHRRKQYWAGSVPILVHFCCVQNIVPGTSYSHKPTHAHTPESRTSRRCPRPQCSSQRISRRTLLTGRPAHENHGGTRTRLHKKQAIVSYDAGAR